jgi:hypothetical protein
VGQLHLEAASIADIAENGQQAGHAFDFQLASGKIDFNLMPILLPQPCRQVPTDAGAAQHGKDRLPVFGVGPEPQLEGGVADEFRSIESRQFREAVVDLDQAAVASVGQRETVLPRVESSLR